MAQPLESNEFQHMSFAERLDWMGKHIMLSGAPRPWFIFLWHLKIYAANYVGFALLAMLVPRPSGMSAAAYTRLVFLKFLVWQHMAEAIGCRQGPLSGHFALPNNWRYRLGAGTLKVPLLRLLGDKRTLLDVLVHSAFFLASWAFLLSPFFQVGLLRAVCLCDVCILFSDLTQFFASAGHAYWSMLFAGCFPAEEGQLAGMQLALVFQWFFAGVGKVGPWFVYVNAPFLMQSKWFRGRRWLFKLLARSKENLGPTGACTFLGCATAAFECLVPVALTVPHMTWISAGLVGIVAMHLYILAMPAPFDVYAWNTAFLLSCVYLFYGSGVFGFDHQGLSQMHPLLARVLLFEFALCWCGQFFPNHIGGYFCHRHWAGNWAQSMFFARKTESVRAKLAKVRPATGKAEEEPKQLMTFFGLAYLWLGCLNMKCFARLVQQAVELVGAGADVDDYELVPLREYWCGEFKDALYTKDVLPGIQREMGFEKGECFMVQLGAFPMFGECASWKIHDMSSGTLASGTMTTAGMAAMDTLPSAALDPGLACDEGKSGMHAPLLPALL